MFVVGDLYGLAIIVNEHYYQSFILSKHTFAITFSDPALRWDMVLA